MTGFFRDYLLPPVLATACSAPYTPCGREHAARGPQRFPLECSCESLAQLVPYLSRTPGAVADGAAAHWSCADFLDRGATGDRESGNFDFAGCGFGSAALAGGICSRHDGRLALAGNSLE